jgi:predicted nuclease of predicted toxin-antitoxin system
VSRADSPDPLLLDEMFTALIADHLKDRGIDCRAVTADPTLRSLGDADVLAAALADGGVLVTNNVPDFEALRRVRQGDSLPVPQLIYTSDSAFPRDRKFIARLVTALEGAAKDHLAARHGGVLWLNSPNI